MLVAALLIAPVGCSKQNSSPEFRVNLQTILANPAINRKPEEFNRKGDEEQQKNYERLEFLASALDAAFGTPDEPYLFDEVKWNPDEKKGLDLRKIKLAAGPYGSTGERRGLFRQHCAHCHGVSGDGAGPTAAFLNPYPRDYRQGAFKFKSTERNAKPTNDDLKRILQEGIPGTAMPSFLLLPNDEIEALVEYVKYLSVRGQTETNMSIDLFANDEDIEHTKQAILENYLQPVIDDWAAAEELVVNPPARSESQTDQDLRDSIAKGRELFFRKETQCTKCHGPTALGDGNDGAPEKDHLFDDWNKEKTPDNMAFWLLPKQELRPRDLRMGIYRGGRRPLDIFRRIHQGIPGTPMPAGVKDEKNPAGALKPEEIWHLVDYVRSLPFEEASEPAQFEEHGATAMAGQR